MKEIFFHIITPVYNVEKYLNDCILSVENQPYPYFELVLVDDGSTDKSGKICDMYARKTKNIKVIHKSNQGLLAARQTGLNFVFENKLSPLFHHYFLALDSDDMLALNALSTIAKRIKENHFCDILVYSMERVKDDGSVIDNSVPASYVGLLSEKKKLFSVVLVDDQYNSLCRKAISANVIKRVNLSSYWGVQHGEDLLQSLEYWANADTVCFVSDVFYRYRYNPKSITNSKFSRDRIAEYEKLYSYELSFLEKKGIFTDVEMKVFIDHAAFNLLSILNTAFVQRDGKLMADLVADCSSREFCRIIAQKSDKSLWPLGCVVGGRAFAPYAIRFWFGCRRLRRLLGLNVRMY